ncbi:P-type conjugative transfer protein TrbJ [Pseudomonas petrae]|uniref:P-type conjugative transfer protein TrbJ n=1 Tax=Pseudomonas petrae TaxID=2912190 RepID=UPI001F00C18E|nr:P-type conjugative transfer protein TrbJ [Pseudomonas petrae]MCF7554543.1 P-type conjugative transfer protein TrbJ [Pseudomonas petrae]
MKQGSTKRAYPISYKIGRSAMLAITMAATCLAGTVFYSSAAYAIYCSNCSTFYQQMFQYAEEVNTSLNTAEQLKKQIQQYQNMITQGKSLPNSMFGSIATDLKSVVSIYNRSQSLGRELQNIDTQFNDKYPGFQSYLNGAANYTSLTTEEHYQNWSEQGRDNVRSALDAANLNTSSFESEDTKLASMVARSQSAVGRMQAIQAGNEIASQNVQQLQKLRDLLATQINMQGNYMAQQGDRHDISDATEQKFKDEPTIRGGSKGY